MSKKETYLKKNILNNYKLEYEDCVNGKMMAVFFKLTHLCMAV